MAPLDPDSGSESGPTALVQNNLYFLKMSQIKAFVFRGKTFYSMKVILIATIS
jgi:hypothetical protein